MINFNVSLLTLNESVIWVEPTKTASPAIDTKSPVLNTADVVSWRENGYCLVDGIYPQDLLELVLKDCETVFPAPLSEEAKKLQIFMGDLSFRLFPTLPIVWLCTRD